MRYFIKILLSLALFLVKALVVFKNLLASLLKVLFRPGIVVLRFFYYRSVLPLYRLYLFVAKKFGWSKRKKSKKITALLLNKRIIHFLVVGLTLFFVYVNFTSVREVFSSEEVVGKTILAKMVADELAESDELIEETQPADGAMTPLNNYFDSGAYLRPPLALNLAEEEEGFNPEATGVAEEPAAVGKRTEIVEYTVKVGDTIGGIARRFGVSAETILWENNLSAKGYIKPGNKLRILPSSGVTYKVVRGDNLAAIAKRHGVEPAQILEANGISNANQLKAGQVLIIPGGKKIVGRSTASGQQPSGSIIGAPQGAVSPVAGVKLNWPVRGRLTQYYSWRHNGLDIANKTGTPVYAAEAGTVVEIGWNSGGYGYQVVLDHGGGKRTRYAHLSKFAVGKGEEVAKGQNIAFVGSTGRSTGPHLHFEVMISGRRYNPLNYLAY